MLLQKYYINDPIEKKRIINSGAKPQCYVENSHEPILDRDTYERILAEKKHRADKYLPPGSRGPRRSYPFTGKIVCEQCGAHYRRRMAHSGIKYKSPVWICATLKTKGRDYCPSKQIPEDILRAAAARVLGLPALDEKVFNKEISEIRVPDNGTLVFVFYDGREISESWQNRSRRESWGEEQRQQARDKTLQYYKTKRSGVTQGIAVMNNS